MLTAYGYGTAAEASDPLGTSAEILSLLLIFASVLIMAYLAARVRSRRSFQFEMFLFTLVLAGAEIPKILYSLSGLDLGGLVTYGLAIHSASMVILVAFVAYRTYGFFRGRTDALK